MEPSGKLVVELRHERLDDARRMGFAEKFWAGAELFDYACEVTKAGIRADHPSFDEVQILKELRRRIAIRAKIEGDR